MSDHQDIDDWIAGDDKILRFSIVDETGAALDLAGASFEWALYSWHSADPTGTAVVTKNTATVTGNVAEISVDGADTTALDTGRYQQIFRITQNGRLSTVVQGAVKIKQRLP